ncbi:MAG: thioredoxin family protein [Candidatus Melainabacteria bacterium]|nr:thioredoxin family protein [Candidatus Melainabacteria bacterium]
MISGLNIHSAQSKTAQGFLTALALTMTVAASSANAQSTDSRAVSSPANQAEISVDVAATRQDTSKTLTVNSLPTETKGVLIAAGPATAKTIPWQNSLNKTFQLARTNRKWILVDVYTDWCHWCKRLDSDVYAQPAVAKFLNKSFVCLKVDAEKGDGINVKSKYGVDGYPCTLILEPGGKEKGRIEGYQSPRDFTNSITQILNKP